MRRLLASLPKKDRLKAGQGTTLRGMWRYIVSILNGVTVSRASTRTVLGYASDATIADGQSLLTVPVNVGAYPGQRLATDYAFGAIPGPNELANANVVITIGSFDYDAVTDTYTSTAVGASRLTVASGSQTIGDKYYIEYYIDGISSGLYAIHYLGAGYSTGVNDLGRRVAQNVVATRTNFIIDVPNIGCTIKELKVYRLTPQWKTTTLESPYRNCVAIGDSITGGSTWNGSYLPALESYYPWLGTITDKGVGGQNIAQIEARFATDVVALSPTGCIIQAITNDLLVATGSVLSLYTTKLSSMLSQAVAAGIKPCVFGPPPLGSSAGWNATKQAALDEVRAAAPGIAATYGADYVDLYAVLGGGTDSLLTAYDTNGDGIHPGALGNTAIALAGADIFSYTETPLGNPVVVDVADSATNLFQGYNKTNLSLTNWLTSGVGASLSIVTTEGSQAFYRLTAPAGNAVFAYHNIGGTADTSIHSIGAAIKGGTGATSIGSASGKAAFGASSAFRVVENNGVTPAGGGGKIVIHADAGQTVDFYLNTLVNASTVGPLIITNGSTALRAADQASTPTPPLLSTAEGAQRIEFTPHQAGQVDKTVVAFYVDATHKMELTINATQVLASYTDGANTDSAAFTYSHVANTAAYADWYWDSSANEIGVRAAHTSGNIDGETFATATFAGLTSLPATQQLGHENGSAVLSGIIGELDIFYASKSDAGW